MKTVALAGALSLLLASSTLCIANSSPWCAADVAILNFKNYKGQDLAKIELRSLKAVCDRNPGKEGFGANLERSMRIEHNGQWTDVPKACLSGFSFAVEGLALSGDDAGLGILLIGKSTDDDKRVKRSIFKLDDGISCYQIERYPNVDDQDHEIREYNRDLQ
ncbi:hypothetical protein JQ559_26630 [Bradyrhizobium viridifuturi]|jgi:hypothetical protein|uniref:hypothetical protein n=1 Tax=Bradyrhizobium TaxID=374 RepID=UPI000AC6852C|nr:MULTISPECIES: hypothetical protein [Bradyrhizobium]QRI69245.1 hypothetical protein JQ507_30980 [Bradyrhizobium sp. PSBB068]MBR1022222.1 hypothetical protein [Bradyrhizobium viridifuturi]MBR1036871.1 hypothetical protein [Bradyrhizobium viridifuturi]MBR1047241.1 hypothetical protein [Bradyrhizobium viridifuturi]MBR1072998.1 hypothetical protein [Bradyrhizobium viridifuturi]